MEQEKRISEERPRGIEKFNAKTTPIRMLLVFSLMLGFLLLVYLPTFLYPYLLLDEAWIVHPGTHTWVYSMGRPLFSLLSWMAALIHAEHGLGVIHAMRGSAVIALAFSAYFLMSWLEHWGHKRWAAIGFALAAMTLPAYQIVVADGTQLAFAILFAVLATIVFYRGFERRSALLITSSAILLAGALLIYQQQALIVFALLAVPLLQCPGQRRAQLLAIWSVVFVTVVSCLYFVVWRIVYRILWPDRIDTRYGPDAIGLPTYGQIINFIDIRLSQVANLWHIYGVPKLSWIMVGVVLLIASKISYDIRTRGRAALLSYAMLAVLIVASDGFAIIARAYSSYTTATALSLLIFYWAFAGMERIIGPRTAPVACGLAIMGGIFAFVTVKKEIAIPNWQHFQEIRSAMLTHPAAENFHFTGMKRSGPGYQEFGWRNASTDVYLNLVAIDVANDLLVKKIISSEQRTKMFFSISHVEQRAAPDFPCEPRPDSVIVPLNGSSE